MRERDDQKKMLQNTERRQKKIQTQQFRVARSWHYPECIFFFFFPAPNSKQSQLKIVRFSKKKKNETSQ